MKIVARMETASQEQCSAEDRKDMQEELCQDRDRWLGCHIPTKSGNVNARRNE